MNIENIQFHTASNHKLIGKIYYSDYHNTHAIIFSHGLFSSMDGYKITRIASDIINAGYTLMTFNFRFINNPDEDISNISIMQEVEDLKAAILFFTGKIKKIQKIHLMGSSMGATVSILIASLNQFNITSLILIATPINFLNLIPSLSYNAIQSLKNDEYKSISGIMIKNTFIKEIADIDMISAIQRIQCPSLLIHGRLDTVVNIADMLTYIDIVKSKTHKVIIENGDHNLTNDSDIRLISEELIKWLDSFNS